MVSTNTKLRAGVGAPPQPAVTVQVFGLSHATAPVALREQVAFAADDLADHLARARQALALDEVAILSTCNRTEIYAVGDAGFAAFATGWPPPTRCRPRSCSVPVTPTAMARHCAT